MKKAFGIMLAISTFGTAPAMADEALATAKGCLACHQVQVKVVGPAYKDIAAKYRGSADAAAVLTAKIKSGGVGTWGPIPMPPQPMLSDEDAAKLAAWVMSL